jgi:hypothetical protein
MMNLRSMRAGSCPAKRQGALGLVGLEFAQPEFSTYPQQVFTAVNFAVLPFWALMIAAPKVGARFFFVYSLFALTAFTLMLGSFSFFPFCLKIDVHRICRLHENPTSNNTRLIYFFCSALGWQWQVTQQTMKGSLPILLIAGMHLSMVSH